MMVFITDCVSAIGEDINAMTRASVEVSYDVMLKHVGKAFVDKQKELGYDVGNMRGGLRMKRDWAVSYFRSAYKGRPCYYFVWSHIEYVFCEATTFGVIDGQRDKEGRAPFTLFWRYDDGRKQAQCFNAVPEHSANVVWVETEAEAKARAWGEQ